MSNEQLNETSGGLRDEVAKDLEKRGLGMGLKASG